MEKEGKQTNSTTPQGLERFDRVLAQHIERLIGTKYGLEPLPLNLVTITSLFLLAEREDQVNNVPSKASERYTPRTLGDELAEIGIDPDENLDATLQDMTQKGYVNIDENGKLSAQKPTYSMVQLLNRAFPKMSGMNLVAYLVQTIVELQSKRKGLDFALAQLDQTLQIHGVSLLEKKARSIPGKMPKAPTRHTLKRGNIKKPSVSRSQPKILSSNGESGLVEAKNVEIKELSNWDYETPVVSHETEDPEGPIKPDQPFGTEKGKARDGDNSERPSPLSGMEIAHPEAPSGSFPDIEKSNMPRIETVKSDSTGLSLQSNDTADTQLTFVRDHSPISEDELIEKQIAAFEVDLAMQCPVCRNAKIQIKQTPKSKAYYICTNKDCGFISWGKPYHLICPQCHNPFLIEISDKKGNTILKCPRATCRYRQRLPGEVPEELQEEPRSQTKKKASQTARPRKLPRRVIRRVVRRKNRS
jgi:ssDNA-binding Zn-finger/Zn-ribbon topoisomerase 1